MLNKFYQQVRMLIAPTAPEHLVRLQDLNERFKDFDFQGDILNIQTDDVLDPGASIATGARYIITNPATLHANFGTIAGVEANDIVEYNGTGFVVAYDVSVRGSGAMVWDCTTKEFKKWTGTSWSSTQATAKYTADFLTSDWAGAIAPYTLTIDASTHGLGNTKGLMVAVYEDGAPNEQVYCGIAVADSGQVVISTSSKFAGHYVIV